MILTVMHNTERELGLEITRLGFLEDSPSVNVKQVDSRSFTGRRARHQSLAQLVHIFGYGYARYARLGLFRRLARACRCSRRSHHVRDRGETLFFSEVPKSHTRAASNFDFRFVDPRENPNASHTRFQSEKVRISTASGKFALPQLFAATWQCPRVRGSPFATDARARHLARRARTAVRASAPHTPPGARQGRRLRLAPPGSSSRPAPPARALILPSERSGVRDDDGLDGDDGVSRARRDGS